GVLRSDADNGVLRSDADNMEVSRRMLKIPGGPEEDADNKGPEEDDDNMGVLRSDADVMGVLRSDDDNMGDAKRSAQETRLQNEVEWDQGEQSVEMYYMGREGMIVKGTVNGRRIVRRDSRMKSKGAREEEPKFDKDLSISVMPGVTARLAQSCQ
ncbi:hypothetical protein CYMTET_27372, partial [Cymbomonas tetramitiformis]